MTGRPTTSTSVPAGLMFRPQEPLRKRRRALDAVFVVFPVIAAAVVLADDSPGAVLTVVAIVTLAATGLRAAAWLADWLGPGRKRAADREIVLTPSLVQRVRVLQSRDRGREAASLLRGETDLSLTDTARALRLIRDHPPR